VYSDNNGQTWVKAGGIQAGEFPAFTALANGELYVVSREQVKGILRSVDNGETWTTANGNLVNFQGIYLIQGIKASENSLYVIASENPFSGESSLYISTDFGETWSKPSALPEASYLEFAGMNGQWPVIHFMENDDAGTYQFSKDGGATWVNVTPGISPLEIEDVIGITGNGAAGDVILFGKKDGKTRVYISLNEGGFTDITSNLDGESVQIFESGRWGGGDAYRPVASYRMDGADFMLAAWDYSGFPQGLFFFRLNPEKNGWIKMGGDPFPTGNHLQVQSLTHSGGAWYFATSLGVFASANNGINWTLIWNNEGLQDGMRPLSFNLTNYGAFLGTAGAGLWRAELTPPIFITLPASEITGETAISGAEIISTGGLPFGNKGICWGTTTNPTISDNTRYLGNTWESFTDTIRSLSPNTDYFLRSFIISPKGGIVYGNEITFRTDYATHSEANQSSQPVVIFPNPSDGRFTIISSMEYKLAIHNSTGKLITDGRIHAGYNSISISDPVPGIYYIKLTSNTNEPVVLPLLVR
jgi:hypothetical protein